MTIARGTPEHRAVVVANVREFIAAGGERRDDFMRWEGRKVAKDEISLYGWRRLFIAAKATAGVDVSGLDWDDDEHDTAPMAGPLCAPLDPVPSGYEVRRISSLVDAKGELDRQWIEAPVARAPGELHDIIPEAHRVRGVSTLVSGDGRIAAQWIKTREEHESTEELLERLFRELPSRVEAREGRIEGPASIDDADVLAVYPMGDPHVGMLSWAPETGESFDLGKARELMCGAMSELVMRGPRTRQALICNLGDFYHSDNAQNRTARSGHALDVDGRWPKVLQVGVEILVFMIDRALEHHERVRVINAIGNHDDHSAVFLSAFLGAYYRNEPRVEIDQSPTARHYFRFGRNLVGVTHGHNQKIDELESIMAAERPVDWGETEHRFWYIGHLHHSIRKEKRGCMLEVFRTLSPRDAWSAFAGYRSGRDMHRIALHREWGEVGRDIVNADFLQAQFRAMEAA